jgi:transposase
VTRIICGVDIASSSLEARIGRQGVLTSFPNSSEGIAALAVFCRAHHVELVAMEATGGYEQQAFAQLSEQSLAVAILNPRARCATLPRAWAGWKRPTPSTQA